MPRARSRVTIERARPERERMLGASDECVVRYITNSLLNVPNARYLIPRTEQEGLIMLLQIRLLNKRWHVLVMDCAKSFCDEFAAKRADSLFVWNHDSFHYKLSVKMSSDPPPSRKKLARYLADFIDGYEDMDGWSRDEMLEEEGLPQEMINILEYDYSDMVRHILRHGGLDYCNELERDFGPSVSFSLEIGGSKDIPTLLSVVSDSCDSESSSNPKSSIGRAEPHDELVLSMRAFKFLVLVIGGRSDGVYITNPWLIKTNTRMTKEEFPHPSTKCISLWIPWASPTGQTLWLSAMAHDDNDEWIGEDGYYQDDF